MPITRFEVLAIALTSQSLRLARDQSASSQHRNCAIRAIRVHAVQFSRSRCATAQMYSLQFLDHRAYDLNSYKRNRLRKHDIELKLFLRRCASRRIFPWCYASHLRNQSASQLPQWCTAQPDNQIELDFLMTQLFTPESLSAFEDTSTAICRVISSTTSARSS